MAKNKEKGSVFAVIQQIGKSFFLPVSVLPIAGVLLGLGSSFTNEKQLRHIICKVSWEKAPY